MMKPFRLNTALVAAAAVGLAALGALSTPISAHDGEVHHKLVPIEEVAFKPGPGTLPAGAQFAVLHGNPAEPGPFVMRLKFPAGYTIPPHMHPEEEHVTVISGGFGMGVGEVHDRSKAPLLQAGSFVQIPVGMAHFAWTAEETVVQINAIGPFGITYLNPADDPRHAAAELSTATPVAAADWIRCHDETTMYIGRLVDGKCLSQYGPLEKPTTGSSNDVGAVESHVPSSAGS